MISKTIYAMVGLLKKALREYDRALQIVLDLTNDSTRGLAGWVKQFFLFAFIGGFTTFLRLIVFFLVDRYVHGPVNDIAHNAIAFIIASEVSLLANFILNDYFTFRRLAGNRPWSLRCVRFHITACSGIILTYILQFCFNFLLRLPSVLALAAAILIVLFYNFTFHHIFTYRRAKPAVSSIISAGSEAELIKQVQAEQIDLAIDRSASTSTDAT